MIDDRQDGALRMERGEMMRRIGHGLLVTVLLPGALLSVALLPGTAMAREKDSSPKIATASLRYGPLTLNDASIAKVYGTGGLELMRLDYGLTSEYFEGTMGIGFFQELGTQIRTTDGTSTDEHIMLTMWPMNLDAMVKLDFLYEQPIVPFARAGADMWIWTENWGSRLGGEIPYEQVSGGKGGWHYGFGGLLLLDFLDRKTADRVEAVSGINDTFLIFEYRKTTMFDAAGLDLGSTEMSIGLKLDF